MFDIAISLNFNKTNMNDKLDIVKFPDRISPQRMQCHSSWYNVKAYYQKGLCHQWTYSAEKFRLFSLGQILFRSDSKYSETPVDKALEQVLEIWKSSREKITNHIKGNFILFILDDDKKELQVVTSKSCHYDLYVANFQSHYYLSTSLDSLLSIDDSLKAIDPVSVIEIGIFDYPLGRKSLYKNIKWLEQGFSYSFSLNSFKESQYFTWTDSLKVYNPKLTWKDTYAKVTDIFNRTLDRQLAGKKKIISAITSGFDSRTILAYLLKHHNQDCKYYSWGKKEHVDVIVPQEIAQKFKLNYLFCDFGEDFHNDYLTSTQDAIFFSDARATLRRANHFYYYKVLSEYSHYNFTGLYGSEILRPISTIGHMFNNNFLKIFLHPDETVILEIIEKEKVKGFLNPEFISNNEDELLLHIKNYVVGIKQGLPDYLALHNFTLTSGLMKYFGHEVHGTRAYVITYSPYIDDEFIEFILTTPTLELDRIALELNLKQSFSHTRRGQMFYLPAIKANCKALMKQRTGRFYSPAQLISPLYPLSIIPALLKKKSYQKKMPLMGSEEWINNFISQNANLVDFAEKMFQKMPEYSKDIFTDFAKHISLRHWLNRTQSTL